METKKIYKFKIPDKKSIAKFVAGYGLLVLLALLLTMFVDEDFGFVIILVIVIGLIALFYLAAKHYYSLEETIRIEDSFLVSRNYGKIYFDQVQSVYSIEGYRSSFTKLVLKNGKIIRWNTAFTFSPQAVGDFYGFYHELPKTFEQYKNKMDVSSTNV